MINKLKLHYSYQKLKNLLIKKLSILIKIKVHKIKMIYLFSKIWVIIQIAQINKVIKT